MTPVASKLKRQPYMTPRLASAAVTTQLLGLRGRTIVNTKEHHLVVDSPLYLGGPNEEINPIDLLLSSLATHTLFTIEKYAQQNRIPLDDLKISISADYDPRGMLGEPVDAGLQALKVQMVVSGPTEVQLKELTEAFTTRCPIYVTLARAVKINLDIALAKPATSLPAVAK
jgi:uncharacterized OsmC-like protein